MASTSGILPAYQSLGLIESFVREEPKPTPSAEIEEIEGELIREKLKGRIAIHPLVRASDRSLVDRAGFPKGCLEKAFREAKGNKDERLCDALKAPTKELLSQSGNSELFLSLKPLGKGNFSTVSAAILRNGSFVAASVPQSKAVALESEKPKEVPYLEFLRGCSNIIQLFGYEKGNCYFEIAKCNLRDFLSSGGTTFPSFSIMLGILEGGVQLVEHGVIHLDLKPENILIVGEKNIPKIADFGLVSWADEDGVAVEPVGKGNLLHFSPERHAQCALGSSSDRQVSVQDNVWGFMMILCRIATVTKSSNPHRNFSSDFKKRYDTYALTDLRQVHRDALSFAETALVKEGKPVEQVQNTVHYFRAFNTGMLELLKKWDGNLFSGLTPQTGFDFIAMKMAMFHPEHRIEISEARDLFRAIKASPDAIVQLMGVEQRLLEINREIFELEEKIAVLENKLAQNPEEIENQINSKRDEIDDMVLLFNVLNEKRSRLERGVEGESEDGFDLSTLRRLEQINQEMNELEQQLGFLEQDLNALRFLLQKRSEVEVDSEYADIEADLEKLTGQLDLLTEEEWRLEEEREARMDKLKNLDIK